MHEYDVFDIDNRFLGAVEADNMREAKEAAVRKFGVRAAYVRKHR